MLLLLSSSIERSLERAARLFETYVQYPPEVLDPIHFFTRASTRARIKKSDKPKTAVAFSSSVVSRRPVPRSVEMVLTAWRSPGVRHIRWRFVDTKGDGAHKSVSNRRPADPRFRHQEGCIGAQGKDGCGRASTLRLIRSFSWRRACWAPTSLPGISSTGCV